jgi:hypothetical protein
MPKGPPPTWSRRDCRFDHLVMAALGQGYGKVLVYNGIESEERAHDIRRGIYRCAKHRGVSADAGRSVLASGEDEMGVRRAVGGTFSLRYRLLTSGMPVKPTSPGTDPTGKPGLTTLDGQHRLTNANRGPTAMNTEGSLRDPLRYMRPDAARAARPGAD